MLCDLDTAIDDKEREEAENLIDGDITKDAEIYDHKH